MIHSFNPDQSLREILLMERPSPAIGEAPGEGGGRRVSGGVLSNTILTDNGRVRTHRSGAPAVGQGREERGRVKSNDNVTELHRRRGWGNANRCPRGRGKETSLFPYRHCPHPFVLMDVWPSVPTEVCLLQVPGFGSRNHLLQAQTNFPARPGERHWPAAGRTRLRCWRRYSLANA